jgi:hypothetical protein
MVVLLPTPWYSVGNEVAYGSSYFVNFFMYIGVHHKILHLVSGFI